MDRNDISILFMDDEIFADGVDIVVDAVSALQDKGYQVTVCEKMSDAVDEFYKTPCKKVFILDIDMSHVEDVFSGRGSNVASIYRALDNDSSVIMYSAKGEVEDWFEVANRHVFGYVHKDNPQAIEKLLNLVDKAVLRGQAGLQLPDSRTSGKILAAELECSVLSNDDMRAIADNAGFEIEFCPLLEIEELLTTGTFAAGILLADSFSAKPNRFAPIKNICNVQPQPNVIIGIQGTLNNRGAIIDIINERPFRLIDLKKEDLENRIVDSIRAAAHWYGGNETFQAETKYVRGASENIDWGELKEHFVTDPDDDFESEEVNGGE